MLTRLIPIVLASLVTACAPDDAVASLEPPAKWTLSDKAPWSTAGMSAALEQDNAIEWHDPVIVSWTIGSRRGGSPLMILTSLVVARNTNGWTLAELYRHPFYENEWFVSSSVACGPDGCDWDVGKHDFDERPSPEQLRGAVEALEWLEPDAHAGVARLAQGICPTAWQDWLGELP